MPTYPDSPPLMTDAEWRSEVADTSAIWRKVARWQNYQYRKQLYYVPSDVVIAGVKPTTGYHTRGGHTHDTGGTPDATPVKVGSFYIPHPRSFAQRLRFHAYTERYSSTNVFCLDFVQQATGKKVSIEINQALIGTTIGWATFLVGGLTQGWVDLYVRWVSGSWGELYGLCGWWEQLSGVRSDISIDSGWTPAIAQGYAVANEPDSAALARWLIRKANLFASEHPVPVCSFWLGPSAAYGATHTLGDYQQEQGNMEGGYQQFVTGRVMARYKVLVSPFISTVNVKVGVSCTDGLTGGVTVKVDGTSIGTFTPSAIGQCQFSTLTYSSGVGTATVREVTVESSGTFTTNGVALWSVQIWESGDATAGSLSLPGSDTLPASFVPIADEAIGARLPIAASMDLKGRVSGRSQMVKNLIWLWAKRGTRILVSDSCRMRASDAAYGPNIDPGDGSGYRRSFIGLTDVFCHTTDSADRFYRYYLSGNIDEVVGGGRNESALSSFAVTSGGVWTTVLQWVPATRMFGADCYIIDGWQVTPPWSRTLYHYQATSDTGSDGTNPQQASAEEVMV